MNGKISGLIKAAGSLSLAGGILAAAAGPAAAAAAPNEAYGASATGLVDLAPVALATSPGTSPVTLVNVGAGSLLSARIIADTASATSASSTVANIRSVLSPRVGVDIAAVTSSCSFDPNSGTVSGGTSIVNGHFGGLSPTPMATHPAPNTTINVAGVATVVLNRQTTAPDGTLTVDAIYVSLVGGAQTFSIATSVCNDASLAPVSILPGKALPIGLGGLTVLMLGGVGYQFSRRRRQATAA